MAEGRENYLIDATVLAWATIAAMKALRVAPAQFAYGTAEAWMKQNVKIVIREYVKLMNNAPQMEV